MLFLLILDTLIYLWLSTYNQGSCYFCDCPTNNAPNLALGLELTKHKAKWASFEPNKSTDAPFQKGAINHHDTNFLAFTYVE